MKRAPALTALLALAGGLALASPAYAQIPTPPKGAAQLGLEGALRGCETWVLDPASWAEGTAPFIAAVDLGPKFGPVSTAMPEAQPPAELRAGNQYWGINAAPEGGMFLVVSDQLPMCHITGGGPGDLQPAVEAVILSAEFLSRWQAVNQGTHDGIVTTHYQYRDEPRFEIAISRADAAGGRTDRAQIIATALMKLEQ